MNLWLNYLCLLLLFVALYCVIFGCDKIGDDMKVRGLQLAASPNGSRTLTWKPPKGDIGTLTYSLKMVLNNKTVVNEPSLKETKYELPNTLEGATYDITIIASNIKGAGPPYTKSLRIWKTPDLITELKFDQIWGSVGAMKPGSGYVVAVPLPGHGSPTYFPAFNSILFADRVPTVYDLVVTASYQGTDYPVQSASFEQAYPELSASWLPPSQNAKQPVLNLKPGDTWTLNLKLTNPAGVFTYSKQFQVPITAPGQVSDLEVIYG